MTHLLVDDLHSLRHAGMPEGTVWSCSTGLPYLLDRARTVRTPETLVTQPELDAIWKSVLDASAAADGALGDAERSEAAWAHLRQTHASQIYAAFVQFSYKGLLLARWMNEIKKDCRVIGCPQAAGPSELNLGGARHDHVFAAIAARMPDGPAVTSVPAVDRAAFARAFTHVPPFDRVFNLVNRPWSALRYKMWDKLGARPFGGRVGVALILMGADFVEESFLDLLRAGWRVARVEQPRGPVSAKSDRPVTQLLRPLEHIWRRAMAGHLPEAVAEGCWRELAPRLEHVFAAHPAWLAATRSAIDDWRRRHGGPDAPLVLLSSGLYSPAQRMLDGCLRDAGIPVIAADHGAGKGLNLLDESFTKYSIECADYYFACNLEAKRLYEKFPQPHRQTILDGGSPSIMSESRWPRLQRRAARRYLKVRREEPLLMYVTSLAANNRPLGFGSSTDEVYARNQRAIVELLGAFPGRVVVKPYPAHRFSDPEQIWQMPLPPNTRRAPFGEFRHVRWAADVLLLDLCSSTIGWAMASGVPLIYVDGVNPMTERGAQAARKSLFYVAAVRPGWTEQLRGLIGQPLAALRRQWDEMAVARSEFNERFCLGRPQPFAHGLGPVLCEIAARHGWPRPASMLNRRAAE